MHRATAYVTPPPTAPLLPTDRSPAPSQYLPHIGGFTSSMHPKQPARVARRPLQPRELEKGRVTTTDSSWNWGGYSETHPYLMEDASSSVAAVEDGDVGAAGSTRARRQPDREDFHRGVRHTVAPIPSQHVDERIFFDEVSPPSKVSGSHQRRRSRTFHSTSPPPVIEAVNPKSRSETSVVAPKQRSKLTLQQFQLLVTESLHVEHDVDVREDYPSRRTHITANGFNPHTHRHALHESDSIYSPSTVSSPHRDIVAHEPPSPASFYSASSSPHSDPGYDSDSDVLLDSKEYKEDGKEHDTGFDSDAELTLPAFYRNPLASTSDDTLGTICSIGTMGTMDTMGAALRSLAPETRPTIRELRPKTARGKGRDSGLKEDEKHVSNSPFEGRALEGDRMQSLPRMSTQQGDKDRSMTSKKVAPVPLRGVLRPKRELSTETPSTLALSPNLAGLPNPSASAAATTTRPHSSAVAAHKAMVHGNTEAEGQPPTAAVNAQGQPPPRPPRRVHRVPPPLVLAPPSSSLKNFDNNLGLTPRSASSFRFQFQPPPTPLSPAISIMSTMSTLSTVSTIAAVMLNRPKTKEPRMSEKELRRRRFLKLTKTLGEDVPPELVQVKVAVPKRARTMSFGSSKGKSSKRDSVLGDGKPARMRKKRKDSFDGRRTLGGRRSVAVSPLLDSTFPSIPEGYVDNGAYDALLSPISAVSPISPIAPPSPNVLRKYPSLRRRSNSNPARRPTSDQFTRTSINPTPVMSPEVEQKATLVNTPYFESHPFRLVVEDSSPVPQPSVPRFVEDHTKTSNARSRVPSGLASTANGVRKRESSDSMQNPWMRESLSLPLAADTPFIEYALPCGVARQPSRVRHHRRTSSLDAVSPRRISIVEPSYSDYDHGDGLNIYLNDRAGPFGELRSRTMYLGVPEGYDDDEGEWENVEGGVYRKERRQGWSGEWNQPHIQDVIDKLRQL